MARTRLTWDETFMQAAQTLGERSSCLHYRIGCVFVDDLHRIVTVGYNGALAATSTAAKSAPRKKRQGGHCRGAHDVINAIINCIQPERLRGGALYTTVFPCYDCMKALVQAGVKEIVYRDEYLRRAWRRRTREPEPQGAELASRMGIEVRRYEEPKPAG